MAITLPPEPVGVRHLLKDALLRRQRIAALSGSPRIGSPLSMYALQRASPRRRRSLSGMILVGWCFPILSDDAVALAHVRLASKTPIYAGLIHGPVAEGLLRAARYLEEPSSMPSGEWELRLLAMPLMRATALWLHGAQDDLFVPLQLHGRAEPPSVHDRPGMLAFIEHELRRLRGLAGRMRARNAVQRQRRAPATAASTIVQGPAQLSPSLFWAYSLAVYDDKAFAAACVDMQDRHALDVNMLLFALFCASRGRTLSRDDIERLDAAVDPWRRSVVRPLRGVRRWLEDPAHATDHTVARLRRAVLDREIESEAHQQQLMERTVPIAQDAADPRAAADNLVRYARFAGCADDEAVLAGLATLLARALCVTASVATATISGSAARLSN